MSSAQIGGSALVVGRRLPSHQSTVETPAGSAHTAHTTNPVPLYYVTASDPGVALRGGGKLADVAPTMLELLGIPKPAVMTGESLRIPAP